MMLSENTILKLRKMKLPQIADEYERQMGDQSAIGMSFDERIGLMIDLEYSRRDNNRIKRLTKKATLSNSGACIENIRYTPDRKLDPSLIQTLASCAYIEKHLDVLLLGATGAGKTFLANALAVAACRRFYSVKYCSLKDVLIELAAAQSMGSAGKIFEAYTKPRLLIFDDWLLFSLSNFESQILYSILEARRQVGATIVCSQIEPKGWVDLFDNPVAADSICDRLVHSPYQIFIDGQDSMRKILAAEAASAESYIRHWVYRFAFSKVINQQGWAAIPSSTYYLETSCGAQVAPQHCPILRIRKSTLILLQVPSIFNV
jgi:DNA replication protein DnaC